MDTKWIGIIGILLVGAIVALYAMMTYNAIQSLNLEADNAWSKVETAYQERFDMIPKIVQSVVAQTKEEKELIKNIADARAKYIGAKDVDEKVATAQELDSAINTVFPIVLQENYPNVKFADAFKDFRTIYEGQENRIRVERNRYNDAATEYNKYIKMFPGNLFAGMFGFKEKQLFKAAAGSEKAPELNFSIS